MKFLLDTHTALWWWSNSPDLSDTARRCLSDPSNEVFFSAVSGYEILQKVRSGKLVVPPPLLNNFPGEVQREGWKILPIGLHEAIRAATIASAHRDPFDRLLAAQAETHDLILLTTDSFFQEAGFRAVW